MKCGTGMRTAFIPCALMERRSSRVIYRIRWADDRRKSSLRETTTESSSSRALVPRDQGCIHFSSTSQLPRLTQTTLSIGIQLLSGSVVP